MDRSSLLSVFQSAIVMALLVIGLTFFYALGQQSSPVAGVGAAPTEMASAPAGEEVSGPAKLGKSVWNNRGCGSCHNKSMKDDLTGPALAGVTGRWAAEPRDHLYRWIRNSGQLADSGESARASKMIDWSNQSMSSYADLTDGEIEQLLAYIER